MPNIPSPLPASVPLIQARNVSRVDGPEKAALLKPTDFSLSAGDQLAITGASGSGKSVFLRMLALLDEPASGQVFWCGSPVASEMITHYRSRICYLSQRPALIEGSVLDNLKFPFSLKSLKQRTFDQPAVEQLLAYAGKDPSFVQQNAMDLSGGEAQIVALVRTLQLDPQVMLFDEPTAALDPQSAAAVESLVRHWFAQNPAARAYIWVSHDYQQACRMSTTRMTMDKGRLLTGEAA